jgi:hypothetical protein
MKKLTAFIFAAALSFVLPVYADHDGSGHHCERHGENAAAMPADTDNDGTVDWEEAHNAFIKHFDEMDTNQDGVLSAEETKGHCCMDKSGGKDEKSCKRNARHDAGTRGFEKADKDNDGTLDRKEAKKLPNVLKNFDVIDVDHDGTVDRDEVHNFMHEHMHK